MVTPRPRLLYIAVFSWLAVTGGRFLAPFLQHEAYFSDALIGAVLAASCAVFSLLGSVGGSWADARECTHPNKGRAQVMFVGVALGSTCFLLHGIHLVLPSLSLFASMEWHFVLRILWACSSALVMPVLDGVTLAHLEKTVGMDQSDYGKERLYGAISWAVVNLTIGPIVDRFGFVSLYPFAMIVTVVCFLSIAIYVEGQEAAGELVSQEDCTIDTTEDSSYTKGHSHESSNTSIRVLLGILAGTLYATCFLFAVVCLSSGMSVVESLVFLFFEFLGGSNTMCGITVALTVMFEIPIFSVAPKLLHRLGSGSLLLVAGLAYMIRVVGYSFIPKGHAAFVLLLEPLHGVTYACFQTSTVDFVAHLMPKGSEASGQGLLGVFKGVGSVMGLLLGGVLEETLGPRTMYRIFATIVAVGMLVLSVASWRQEQQPAEKESARHDILPQSETELSSMDTSRDENETGEMYCPSNATKAVVEFI